MWSLTSMDMAPMWGNSGESLQEETLDTRDCPTTGDVDICRSPNCIATPGLTHADGPNMPASSSFPLGRQYAPRPYTAGRDGAGRGCGPGSPAVEEGTARRSVQDGGPPGFSTPRRRQGGPLVTCNAARERTRVKTLRSAFFELQQALPCVPPNTKLSKLDVLVLATMYIAHLMGTLRQEDGALPAHTEGLGAPPGTRRHLELLHPVKKWPMRTRLYAGLAARARGSPPRPDHEEAHQANFRYL